MRACVCLLCWAIFSTSARADNAPPPPKPGKPAAPTLKVDAYPSFTAEREAAAMVFVTAHHVELRPVLEQLKAMEHQEYQTAIRQLFQVSEQLARVKEADEQRYDIEVEEWKVKSRIQLLQARAGVSDDPGFEPQLKELLTRQLDLKIKKIELERIRAAERVTRLDHQITKARNERDADVKAQLNQMLRSIDKARAAFKKRADKSEKK